MKQPNILWSSFKIVAFCTAAFWIIETIFFQLLNGWHYKANSPEEIYCDDIVNYLISVCAFLLFGAMLGRIDKLFNPEEKTNNQYEFWLFEGNAIMVAREIPIAQQNGWELAGECACKFAREGDAERMLIPLKRKLPLKN